MDEHEQLPLARMITIKNPAFWIFLGICIILYSYNKFIGVDRHPDETIYSIYGDIILGAAFVGLFFTIGANIAKKASVAQFLNICCYIFEAASVLVLSILIFSK